MIIIFKCFECHVRSFAHITPHKIHLPVVYVNFTTVNPLQTELNPQCKSSLPNFLAGYLNFAQAFRKTWIFREPSGRNLRNKKHFVGKKTDINQNALKILYVPYCVMEKMSF